MQNQNKRHFIDGKIGEKYYPIFVQIKYNRVRLGHTRFTNKFMPAGEEPPICIICDKQTTLNIFLQIANFTKRLGKDYSENIIIT